MTPTENSTATVPWYKKKQTLLATALLSVAVVGGAAQIFGSSKRAEASDPLGSFRPAGAEVGANALKSDFLNANNAPVVAYSTISSPVVPADQPTQTCLHSLEKTSTGTTAITAYDPNKFNLPSGQVAKQVKLPLNLKWFDTQGVTGEWQKTAGLLTPGSSNYFMNVFGPAVSKLPAAAINWTFSGYTLSDNGNGIVEKGEPLASGEYTFITAPGDEAFWYCFFTNEQLLFSKMFAPNPGATTPPPPTSTNPSTPTSTAAIEKDITNTEYTRTAQLENLTVSVADKNEGKSTTILTGDPKKTADGKADNIDIVYNGSLSFENLAAKKNGKDLYIILPKNQTLILKEAFVNDIAGDTVVGANKDISFTINGDTSNKKWLSDINALTVGSEVGSNTAGLVEGAWTDDRVHGGYGGADTISGLDGNDTLIGWYGNDKLDGGNGSDNLYGEDGSDMLFGGSGNDIYYVHTRDAGDGVEVDTIKDVTGGGVGADYSGGDKDKLEITLEDGKPVTFSRSNDSLIVTLNSATSGGQKIEIQKYFAGSATNTSPGIGLIESIVIKQKDGTAKTYNIQGVVDEINGKDSTTALSGDITGKEVALTAGDDKISIVIDDTDDDDSTIITTKIKAGVVGGVDTLEIPTRYGQTYMQKQIDNANNLEIIFQKGNVVRLENYFATDKASTGGITLAFKDASATKAMTDVFLSYSGQIGKSDVNDALTAKDGKNSRLHGGYGGKDNLKGGEGNDVLVGWYGIDTIFGGNDKDTIYDVGGGENSANSIVSNLSQIDTYEGNLLQGGSSSDLYDVRVDQTSGAYYIVDDYDGKDDELRIMVAAEENFDGYFQRRGFDLIITAEHQAKDANGQPKTVNGVVRIKNYFASGDTANNDLGKGLIEKIIFQKVSNGGINQVGPDYTSDKVSGLPQFKAAADNKVATNPTPSGASFTCGSQLASVNSNNVGNSYATTPIGSLCWTDNMHEVPNGKTNQFGNKLTTDSGEYAKGGEVSPPNYYYQWSAAKNVCEYHFGEGSGWRLPTMTEALTSGGSQNKFGMFDATTGFSSNYGIAMMWTSSLSDGASAMMHVVNLEGQVQQVSKEKSFGLAVRCVK